MKGKTALKIRIITNRPTPNKKPKDQKWRYYFEAFAKFDSKHDIKIGKSVLHIQPISNENIKGSYEFTIREKEFINREKAEKKAKKDLEYFDKIFNLKNLTFIPEWKRLVCTNSNLFIKPKFKVTKMYITYTMVPSEFSNDAIVTFPNFLKKIEKSSFNNQILKCLDFMNKETKSDLERFLISWISFSILYSTKYPTSTDTAAIENFSREGIEFKKLEYLFERHKDDIENLTKVKLISRTGINHSKKLKKSLTNNKKTDILRHSLMCIWIIRGELFHKGKKHDVFLGNLGGYIQDVTKLGILKILH